MKTLKRSVAISLFLMVVFVSGCTEKTTENTETCGDWANPAFVNMKANFVDWADVNYAHFSLTVSFTNVCIYKNATIIVNIFKKPESHVLSVLAFALIDNSTTPDFNLTMSDTGWDGELALNLKQGFKTNPGNFRVKVDLFFEASSEADALAKYDAYLSGINISAALYRPKS
jgi:hypothetical protein